MKIESPNLYLKDDMFRIPIFPPPCQTEIDARESSMSSESGMVPKSAAEKRKSLEIELLNHPVIQFYTLDIEKIKSQIPEKKSQIL